MDLNGLYRPGFPALHFVKKAIIINPVRQADSLPVSSLLYHNQRVCQNPVCCAAPCRDSLADQLHRPCFWGKQGVPSPHVDDIAGKHTAGAWRPPLGVGKRIWNRSQSGLCSRRIGPPSLRSIWKGSLRSMPPFKPPVPPMPPGTPPIHRSAAWWRCWGNSWRAGPHCTG